MKLLAIDTATQACSAALLVGDAIAEDYAEVPRQHNRLILPMVQRLLDEAGLGLGELDALAFGRGPGAFTGVRLAAGVVQGLALGAGLPVVPVSNLAALAQGGVREWGWRRIVACLDARMGELYWGAFTLDDSRGPVAVHGERLTAPEALQLPDSGPWWGVGPGWAAYPPAAALAARLEGVEPARWPRAADVARIAAHDYRAGRMVRAEAALPVYLRDEVARRPS